MKLSEMTFGQARVNGYSKNRWENAKNHWRKNKKGNFKKGHTPHNTGKTKEDYLPLKKVSEKIKEYRKTHPPKTKGKKRPEHSKIMKEWHKNNPEKSTLKNKTPEIIEKIKAHPNYIKTREDLRKRNLTKEFQQKCAKGQARRPTKPEKELNKILNSLYPKEWKYVGDGKDGTFLGTKNPDFINVNGQKKIIEMFGDYWHSEKIKGHSRKKEEEQRKKHFKKYGFSTLIVWEKELKNSNKLEEKLNQFTKLCSPKALQSEKPNGEGECAKK